MKKRLIAILVLVIAVGFIGGGIYFLNYTPYVFRTALIHSKNQLMPKKELEQLYPKEINDINKARVNTTFMLTFNDSTMGNHNLSLNGDYYYDKDNQKAYGDYKLGYNNLVNMEVEFLQKDSKLYYTLKNIFDNYYYIDSNLFISDSLTYEDLLKIINYYFIEIGNNVEGKGLKKENITLTLADKKFKVKKIGLEVTESEMAKINIAFINDIENDSALMKKIVSISKYSSKGELEKKFGEEKKAQQEKINSSKKLFTYNMYTQNINVLRHEIIYDSDIYYIDNFMDDDNHRNIIITYKEEGVTKLETTFIREANNKIRIKMVDDSLNNVSGLYEYKDKIVNLTMTISDKDKSTLGTVIYTLNTQSKGEAYNMNLDVEIKNSVDSTNGVLKITASSKVSATDDIKEIDVGSSLKDITATDQQKLMLFLQDALNKVSPGLNSLTTNNSAV